MTENDEKKLNQDEDSEPDNDTNPPEDEDSEPDNDTNPLEDEDEGCPPPMYVD